MKTKELTEKFISGLRNNSRHDTFIYWNLFSMLNIGHPDFLGEIIKEYKDDDEDFFRVFHKTLRQWDVFGDNYMCAKQKGLIEKFEKERTKLKKWRKEFRGEDYKFDENDPKYVKKGNSLFKLNYEAARLVRCEDSISGHLDSIFYQTISADNNGSLYKYMKTFFEENLK